jgi:peptidoglycan/LPS O-acetylase OafA/YrhL
MLNHHENRIVGLDSLRFIAFLAVYLFHTSPDFKYGYLGVDFFFVLSSFLLTYLALNEFKETGKFSRLNFFIRRALRIFPLYYLIIIFSFLILPPVVNFLEIKITLPKKPLFYWLLISNYDQSDCLFYLKFLWSIAVEEQFYLLFILFAFLFKKRIYFFLGALLFCYFTFMVYASKNSIHIYSNIFSHFPNFCMGMLGAYFWHKRTNIINYVYILFPLSLLGIGAIKNELLFNIFISVFFGSVIIFVAAFGRKGFKYGIFKITENLGRYSYGLYVYSGIIITIFSELIVIHSTFLKIGIQFVSLLLLSYLSYHLYEKHFLRLKTRFRQ